MKKLEPIELIDEVLNHIKIGEHWKKFPFIYLHFKRSEIELSQSDLIRILSKLQLDGYIALGDTGSAEYDHYSATFDGMLFHGYQRQLEIETQERIRADQNGNRIARNELLILHGTWVAAIVGIVVLCWYIFSWYFPHYSDWPYHFWFEKSFQKLKK